MMEITKGYMKEKEVTKGFPLLQLRKTTGTNQLHIQGWGSEGNREYGYASKFTVPPEVTNSLEKFEVSDVFQSLASDAKIYYREVLSVQKYADGYQIQILLNDHDANLNKTWCLDMNMPQCKHFVDWLESNDLITDRGEEMRFVGESK
tara:strand:- start:38 stop:481 length:444 start_codon:yes stop_codon:yes gene_type:complete